MAYGLRASAPLGGDPSRPTSRLRLAVFCYCGSSMHSQHRHHAHVQAPTAALRMIPV